VTQQQEQQQLQLPQQDAPPSCFRLWTGACEALLCTTAWLGGSGLSSCWRNFTGACGVFFFISLPLFKTYPFSLRFVLCHGTVQSRFKEGLEECAVIQRMIDAMTTTSTDSCGDRSGQGCHAGSAAQAVSGEVLAQRFTAGFALTMPDPLLLADGGILELQQQQQEEANGAGDVDNKGQANGNSDGYTKGNLEAVMPPIPAVQQVHRDTHTIAASVRDTDGALSPAAWRSKVAAAQQRFKFLLKKFGDHV
jgi:hypothetical protein